MIKKWKLFLESKNYTNSNTDKNLDEYFNLTSADIQDIFQDFLDEYPELDFEVDIINHNYFYIYFFIKHGDEFKEIITKEKYPIPLETLDLLKIKLKQHNCCIENSIIHYHSNKRYIYLGIKKILTKLIYNHREI